MKREDILSTSLALCLAPLLVACTDEPSDAGDSADLAAPTTDDPNADEEGDMEVDPGGDAAPPVGTSEQTLTVGEVTRSYLLTVPESYTGDEPVPLLLNLHALMSDARQQLALSGFEVVAEREGFLLVTPSGIGRMWNVTGFPVPSTSDDLGFLSALVDALSEDFAIDPDRLYATGQSQGGFLAFDLACAGEIDLAAIAPVAGVMPPDMTAGCAPGRPVPVVQTHGTADPTVDYTASEATLQWWIAFNEASAPPDVTTFPDTFPDNGTSVDRLFYAGGETGADVAHLRVNGGGHSWPGSDGESDIVLADAIWAFLSGYDLNRRVVE